MPPARPIADLADWKLQAKFGTAAPGVLLRKYYAATKVVALESDDIKQMADEGAFGEDVPDVKEILPIRFVISTGARDRERDTLAVAGWELGDYRKNPVVLWAHDYWQPPVARALMVGTEPGALVSVAAFTPREISEFGFMIYQMYRGGFMRATSVGFDPIDWKFNEEVLGVDWLKQSLLEYSAVPVPANPEALVSAKSAGVEITPMVRWAEQVLDKAVPDGAVFISRVAAERIYKIAKAVSSTPVNVSGVVALEPDLVDTVVRRIKADVGRALGKTDPLPPAADASDVAGLSDASPIDAVACKDIQSDTEPQPEPTEPEPAVIDSAPTNAESFPIDALDQPDVTDIGTETTPDHGSEGESISTTQREQFISSDEPSIGREECEDVQSDQTEDESQNEETTEQSTEAEEPQQEAEEEPVAVEQTAEESTPIQEEVVIYVEDDEPPASHDQKEEPVIFIDQEQLTASLRDSVRKEIRRALGRLD